MQFVYGAVVDAYTKKRFPLQFVEFLAHDINAVFGKKKKTNKKKG